MKNIYINKNFRTVHRLVLTRQFSSSSKNLGVNTLLKWVLKDQFDKKNQNIDNNSPKKDIIQKEIIDHTDASKSIKSDLAKIEPAKEAIEKISLNKTPSKKEFTALSDLKNQYEEHLCSDSDSDNESESNSVEVTTQSTKESQLEKLNNLKTYLGSEYKSAIRGINRLKKLFFKEQVSFADNETRKRKIEESSDQGSSLVLGQDKKSRQSVHDFVENLPTDYNPFDDIGTD